METEPQIIGVATIRFAHPVTENNCSFSGRSIYKTIKVKAGQTGSDLAFHRQCESPIQMKGPQRNLKGVCYANLELMEYHFEPNKSDQ